MADLVGGRDNCPLSHAMTSQLPLKNRSLTRHEVLPPQALLLIAPKGRRLPLRAVGQK